MRHPKLLHRSFTGGEMSPEMFSRVDDQRYMNGAALVKNMICKPQGAVMRRPGFRFVRKARDSATNIAVRLLPFTFSTGDTYAIETGRATIDSREIGYFRFHTLGGTLLFSKPNDYVASHAITVFPAPGTTLTAAGHGLTTGDPVVFTLYAEATTIGTNAGTANTTTDRYTLVGASTHMTHGDQIVLDALTMPSYSGGTLERNRIYYVYLPNPSGAPNEFGISLTKYGPPVDFTTTGTNAYISTLPQPVVANRVYYATVVNANDFKVALTKAEALTSNNLTFLQDGYGDRRIHYAYRPGDLVYLTGAGEGSFTCMRTPWCFRENDPYCYRADHLDHAPSVLNYWCRAAGLSSTDTRGRSFAATANATTDRIDIGTAHGLDEGEPVIITYAVSPSVSITSGQVLYVRNKGTNDFEVSATAFGPKIDLDAAGATIKILCAPYYDVPHYYAASDLFQLNVAQSNDVLSIACRNKPFAELRRTSATSWNYTQVRFQSAVSAPTDASCRIGNGASLPRGVQGASHQVTVFNTATPSRLDTQSQHQFAKGEPVYVFGLSGQGIPDGDYVIHDSTVSSSLNLYLASLSTGANITASGTGGTGYVQSALAVTSITSLYVVTSIDRDGIESDPSAQISVTNNLLVPGAYNPITWTAVDGAQRYRVYKNTTGLFGMIAEVTTTTFNDDNVAPDLAIAPPVTDASLFYEQLVTAWNTATSTLTVSSGAPAAGIPIVFETNDALPPEIKEGVTYYVLNPGGTTMQLAASPSSTTPVSFTAGASGQWRCRSGYYPSTVSYFEGRRCLSGALVLSQDVWMTASGTESDMTYALPTVDSDRIRFRPAPLNVGSTARVEHIVPLSHLLLLTNAAELRVTPINDDAITPTSISVRPQSYVGASSVQPVVVNNIVVFAAARGGHLRELGFTQESNSYLSGDLSLRANHLFDGLTLTQLAFQKAPVPMVWAISSNGTLLGMTYLPDEQMGAWHQHTTSGTFESIVALPESTEDVLYVVTKRGSTRFIECSAPQTLGALADTFFFDGGFSYVGTPTTAILGPPHLEGLAVDYVADGVFGSGTFTGGRLTLATAASKVRLGIPFVGQVRTIPVSMQIDAAAATGREKNVNKVWARVNDSGQFRAGPVLDSDALTAAAQTNSPAPAAGQLLDGPQPVTLPGSWSSEGQLLIQTKGAQPLTVVGLTFEVATGG